MYITLEEIKKHLQIDTGYTEEDDYLLMLGDVSEQAVSQHINRDLSTFTKYNGKVPAPIKHAILLMTGHLYNNREINIIGSIVTKIPLSFEYLLSPYINYSSTP